MNRLIDEEVKIKTFAEAREIPLGAVCCFDRVESTMDEAFRLHQGGAENRSIVLSHEQTRGRGRLGRNWISVRGGLYASILLTEFDSEIPYALIAAYGVYRVLTALGLQVTLKWVNDVFYREAKIAGVLVEEKQGCTVVGAGVNLNMCRFPPGLEGGATSYALETGRTLDPADALCMLLEELSPMLDRAHRGEVEGLMEDWERAFLAGGLRGRTVRVVGEYGEVRGMVRGIERRTGALLLQQGAKVREIYEGRLLYED
jgi:BirA family biotin operon repressor/biotin-[acetyl-CoA-carboxylase] ligase